MVFRFIRPLLCLVVCLSLPVLAKNDVVTLTNTEGRSIEVTLKSASQNDVTFLLLKSRKVHTLPFEKLNEQSVDLVKKWKKAGGGLSSDIDVTFKSGKVTRLSKRENYDDRTLSLKPSVVLENRDVLVPTSALKMTVIVFGKSVVDSRAYYVFLNETKAVNAIQPGEEVETAYKMIQQDYDDRGTTSRYGARYHGYCVLVQNNNGEILVQKSVPSTYAGFGKELLKLKEKRYYSKDLEPYDLVR